MIALTGSSSSSKPIGRVNAIERARLLRFLQQPVPQGSGMSIAQIAARFGKSQSWVSNSLRILSLPQSIQAKVVRGEWSPAAAHEIVPYTAVPALMAAIEADIEAHPDAWKSRPGQRAEQIAAEFRSANPDCVLPPRLGRLWQVSAERLPNYVPDRETIAAECALIQATWSPRERAIRAGLHRSLADDPMQWLPPGVSDPASEVRREARRSE